MTELQAFIVKSLLLLIGLAYCQGPSVTVQDVCIPRGSEFYSDVCRATSNNSLLYFKANDTEIFSDAEAAKLGFNINLGHDNAGRIYRNLTANNVQYPMKLVCIESLPVAEGREINELLSYSIRVEDECGPTLVTGVDNGCDSLNMTTGPQSSGKDHDYIIIAAVVTVLVTVAIVVIVVIVGLLVFYYRRRRRPNNHLDGHRLDPSNHGAGDGLSLDEINPPPPDNHGSPVVPEDNRDSTMFMARRLSQRSPPRSEVSRDMESDSEASPACEPTVDFKVQSINAENSDPSIEVPTVIEQCTDEGRMLPAYCCGGQIHMDMNGSYENLTYCVNPLRSQGREKVSPV